MTLDLVTLGEIMLRFTAPSPEVLEQSAVFEVRAAGAESNVAIVAQRMGLKAGWISRLPESPLGRRAVQSVRGHGVDCSRIVWTREGRMGTYYIDFAHSPRPPSVIYDRGNSTFTWLTLDEVDWDYICSARLFHFSGISLALGQNLQRIAQHGLKVAREHEMLVSFDINYRAKLWSPAAAHATIAPLLKDIDILRAGLDEAQLVLGVEGDAAAVAAQLHQRYQLQVVLITDGAHEAVAYDGQLHTRKTGVVDIVDPIGAGDAFMAGFLAGYLKDDLPLGLDMAVTLGGLKHTYLGDIPWCTRDEVLALIKQRQHEFR
jgi:2-dehydro-3-deoxygluconokinase